MSVEFPCLASRHGCLQNLEGCRVLRNVHCSGGALLRHFGETPLLLVTSRLEQALGGPPSPLRGFGETSFAGWLAWPKLTLRRERRMVDLTGIEPVTS